MPQIGDKRRLALYLTLFLLCLLAVFHLLPVPLLTSVVLAILFLFDRKLFRHIDVGLLLTFFFFFIFAGNLGKIPAVRETLTALTNAGAGLTAICASQIISNVPAALLLSGFTDNWQGLLTGVNIGGLGTPIASLASLISLLAFICRVEGQPGRPVSFVVSPCQSHRPGPCSPASPPCWGCCKAKALVPLKGIEKK